MLLISCLVSSLSVCPSRTLLVTQTHTYTHSIIFFVIVAVSIKLILSYVRVDRVFTINNNELSKFLRPNSGGFDFNKYPHNTKSQNKCTKSKNSKIQTGKLFIRNRNSRHKISFKCQQNIVKFEFNLHIRGFFVPLSQFTSVFVMFFLFYLMFDCFVSLF